MAGDGLLLGVGDLLKALAHGVAELLEDPHDLTGVPTLLVLEKCLDTLHILVTNVRRLQHLDHSGSSRGLEEAGHPLLNGSDGGVHRRLVLLQIRLLGLKSIVLLLPLGRGLLHSLGSRGPVLLVLGQLRDHLVPLGLGLRDVRLQLLHLGLAGSNGGRALLRVGVAVAFELGKEGIVTLGLSLNLGLHVLQERDHLADRVGLGGGGEDGGAGNNAHVERGGGG
mmetsp:Transcript_19583/g.44997  ORF Transcript_19583/g.44997 Transcript_19583/m.44997 type:complete len:224 (-) Transcript_19583:45-716(-)